MSINTTIHKGVSTIFKVLKSLLYSAEYVDVVDDGFDRTEVIYTVDVIIDSFSERDVQFLSFSELIQPQDVKGLIRGSQLPVFPSSADVLIVGGDGPRSGKFSVIAFSTDPAGALFTVLLRRV